MAIRVRITCGRIAFPARVTDRIVRNILTVPGRLFTIIECSPESIVAVFFLTVFTKTAFADAASRAWVVVLALRTVIPGNRNARIEPRITVRIGTASAAPLTSIGKSLAHTIGALVVGITIHAVIACGTIGDVIQNTGAFLTGQIGALFYAY